MVLVDYVFVNARPLRGHLRTVFVFTVGPTCIAFLVLNIVLSLEIFPEVTGILTSSHNHLTPKAKGIVGLVLMAPLPTIAVWSLYRILLAIQDRSNTKELCPPLKGQNELSAQTIEVQSKTSSFGEAVIFRPKEVFPASEYFFIVLNGSVVAALKPGEYTRIILDRPVNEIGQYAIQSTGIVKRKYRYNSGMYRAQQDNPIKLSVVFDILSGSPMKVVDPKKAEEYQKKFAYVIPGPRMNDPL